MKTLTIFTPTFNRAHIIHKCYEALLRQTCKDFIWIVIDDGSTDNTREIINNWKKEDRIEIQYIFQNNQGMHGAHNTAHKHAVTPLTMCCDSDDYLSDDAVEIITTIWKEKGSENYAGIIGHDASIDGKILKELPKNLRSTTLYDLRYKLKLRGDFKLVYRTELLKQEPYPIIENEKYLAVGYKYFLIDQKYKLIITDKILCYVDYQLDGGTFNKIKKYVEAPKGFMYYRKKMMPIMHNIKEQWWQATHYVSSAIFAKEKSFIRLSCNKVITILAIPSGIALNMFIRYKYNKNFKLKYKNEK